MCRQLFAFAGKCREERCVRPATIIVYLAGNGWVRSCEHHRSRLPRDAVTQKIGVDVDWKMAAELTAESKRQRRTNKSAA
jgi:hypothetical protein